MLSLATFLYYTYYYINICLDRVMLCDKTIINCTKMYTQNNLAQREGVAARESYDERAEPEK